MKAIVQDRYGSADVLALREVDDPVVTDNGVLVRIRAAAVNAADWHIMRGDPYLARASIGLRRPKARIRGRDFAGQVEAVGKAVTRFQPGDEVYGELGDGNGSFAEYTVVAAGPGGAQARQPDVRAGGRAAAGGDHRADGAARGGSGEARAAGADQRRVRWRRAVRRADSGRRSARR